jgi:hypothetical protein
VQRRDRLGRHVVPAQADDVDSGPSTDCRQRLSYVVANAIRSDRPKLFSAIAPGLFQTSFWGPHDPCTLCRR